VVPISVDQMKERVVSMLKLGCYKEMKFEIPVDEIVLTNILTPKKDDPSSNLWIPVWLVNYHIVSVNDRPATEEDDSLTYHFALNAVDGSLVELS